MSRRPTRLAASARARREDDRGMVLILMALAMVGILVIAAIVVDLGYFRSSMTQDQSIADFAALAAGKKLSTGDYTGACADAVNYVNTNAPGMTAINASTFCAPVASTHCSVLGGTTQATPSETQGKYTVSVHFPVPNAEIADPKYGAGANDGTPCQRMRVIITTAERAFFGGAAGKSGYTGTRSATIRVGVTNEKLIPALWLLDPTGCTSLAVSGGSQLTVGDVSDLTNIISGIIAVDSDGSACTGQQTTISATGAGTLVQAVPTSGSSIGKVNLFAMPPGASLCTDGTRHDCSTADVSSGRLVPQPVSAGERATRGPVDWRWNCKSSYPTFHGITIAPCSTSSTTPAYIDQLRSGVGTSGAPSSGTWQRWSTQSGSNCNPSGTITVSGNWWVDCPSGSGLSIGNGTTVTFESGNVVFDGAITMTGGALNFNTNNPTANLPASCEPPLTNICIGTSAASAAYAYVRGSNPINITGGVFNATRTMVYVNGGYVKVNSSPPSWTSPSAGPFRFLSLWAEASSNKFSMAGGAGVKLHGTFFTPEAVPFSLTGGGDWAQQSAQFISFQMAVSGGGTLALAPNAKDSVTLPPKAGLLIR